MSSSPSSSNNKQFIKTQLIPSIKKNKTCSICLTQHIQKPAVITVCYHTYCTDCILKWADLNKRSCPLCKAEFKSLFVGIDVEFGTYTTKHLSDVVVKECGGGSSSNNNNRVGDLNVRRRDLVARRRAIGISRQELNVVNRRTRPLPRQRSLRQSNVLQWRASIYEQNMHAVPCPSRRPLEQGSIGRNGYKERLLQRVEPWIHRELHAILGDANPDVLVHLVTSLFISSLEETPNVPSGPCDVKINYLECLHPFLLERTITFWHELRCFAESSLNMETYDTVVEYVKWSTRLQRRSS